MKSVFSKTVLGLAIAAATSVSASGAYANEAPIATNDVGVGYVFSGASIQVDVLANDSDANGDALQVESTEGLVSAQHGTVTFTASGVSYLPDSAAFVGNDSFSYTVSDGELTATALVGIAVKPTSPQPETGAPVAMADHVSTLEGESVVISALQNDWDPDNDTIRISYVGGAGPALNGTTSYTDSTITYTPNSGFFGSDAFTYTITDGTQSSISTVAVTVNAISNTAPVAQNDYAAAWALNPSPVVVSVLANDTDVNGDELRVVSVESEAGAQGGTVSFTDTTVIYTPMTINSLGSDSFTYTVSDGEKTSTALVGFYYQPLRSPAEEGPFAQNDDVSTLQGESVVINPLVNDFDLDDKDIWVSSVGGSAPAQNGTVSFTDSTITYTPNDGFVGTDSFIYSISNGEAGSANGPIGVVNITVNPAEAELVTVEAELFSSTGGPYNGFSTFALGELGAINHVQSGDWGEYDVVIPTAGTYLARIYAGSTVGGNARITFDDGQTITAAVPNNGDWDQFDEIVFETTVELSAGSQQLVLEAFGSHNTWEWNADRIELELQ